MPATKRPPLLRRLLTARGRTLEITKSGWLFIVLTLGVGFAAINSGANLLHAIFGVMMALIIGSGVLSERTVARVRARRLPIAPIHAGTAAPIAIDVENVDPRFDILSISVEDDDRIAGAGRCDPVFATHVAPGGSLRLTTTVTMTRRGRHRLPAAVVGTAFPFGLFVKRRELEPPPEVTVYPRLHPVRVERGEIARPGRGDATGRTARAGEFFGLREYREGDDPRRIHWPAVARTNRPVIREHESLGDREVVLELSGGRTGDAAFEDEVERVASMAVAWLTDTGYAVGLRIDGAEVIPPASGNEQRRRLLEALAVAGGPP